MFQSVSGQPKSVDQLNGNDGIAKGLALKKVLRSQIFSTHLESNQFHEPRPGCERSVPAHTKGAFGVLMIKRQWHTMARWLRALTKLLHS